MILQPNRVIVRKYLYNTLFSYYKFIFLCNIEDKPSVDTGAVEVSKVGRFLGTTEEVEVVVAVRVAAVVIMIVVVVAGVVTNRLLAVVAEEIVVLGTGIGPLSDKEGVEAIEVLGVLPIEISFSKNKYLLHCYEFNYALAWLRCIILFLNLHMIYANEIGLSSMSYLFQFKTSFLKQ